MIAIWCQRCVNWFRRNLGVRKKSCDQAKPLGGQHQGGTTSHEDPVATVAASGTEATVAMTLAAVKGEPPVSTAQSCNAAQPGATHYTPAQLEQAELRLKQMELLLINYMQAAALASSESDGSAVQMAEAQLFIQEMTACISELTHLLAHIQMNNAASAVTSQGAANAE